MNLTDEQKGLLRKIVEVHKSGDTSQFLVAHSLDGTELCFRGSHPNVQIVSDDADFHQLAQEMLITLNFTNEGTLCGKTTQAGIKAVESGFGGVGKQSPSDSLPQSVVVQDDPRTTGAKAGGKIFIGHGRSETWRALKDHIVDDLGLEWDEFNRESTAGRFTPEVLNQMLNAAVFAFLVMTADDEHPDGTKHPRENVIHEAGLFQGKLGFKRAIILLEDGCSDFSNIHGLTVIPFPKGNLSAAFHKVDGVLKRERIISVKSTEHLSKENNNPQTPRMISTPPDPQLVIRFEKAPLHTGLYVKNLGPDQTAFNIRIRDVDATNYVLRSEEIDHLEVDKLAPFELRSVRKDGQGSLVLEKFGTPERFLEEKAGQSLKVMILMELEYSDASGKSYVSSSDVTWNALNKKFSVQHGAISDA